MIIQTDRSGTEKNMINVELKGVCKKDISEALMPTKASQERKDYWESIRIIDM